jgi:sulfur carrier protein
MIRLNGQSLASAPGRLADLLAEHGFRGETRGVAVAINGTVVPRSKWNETVLSDGDDIEIVKIMQGG